MKIYEYPPLSLKEFFESCSTIEGQPLEIYDFQEDLFNDKSDFRIINKARQIGISTAIAMEALYYAIWYDHQTILLVSTSDRASKELMDKIKSLLFSMKERFTLNFEDIKASNKTIQNTQRLMEFENKSRISSLPNNPDTIVGFRAHRVYIDEFAHIENSAEVWQSILPSISRGGKLTIISTPKGKIGEFYRLWDESIRKKNNFSQTEIPYTRLKDIKYLSKIEENKEIMTDIQFRQEYCCEFIDENISMFPYEILNPCIIENMETIYSIKTANPIYIGIDFGMIRSSTVIIIIEKADKKWMLRPPIKEFIGKIRTEEEISPTDFKQQLEHIENLIRRIRPTRVFVDSTGYGLPLLEELKRRFGGLIQGINFSNPLKENLITNLRVLFENREIFIPKNEILIDQLHGLERSFTKSELVRYKHSYGKFDDYVWALCLAISPQTIKQGAFAVFSRKT